MNKARRMKKKDEGKSACEAEGSYNLETATNDDLAAVQLSEVQHRLREKKAYATWDHRSRPQCPGSEYLTVHNIPKHGNPNNFIRPENSMMPQKSSWTKKHHSQTARAKAQQRHRRKRGLFKKAAEFCCECESDVFMAVRVRNTGQMYILDSSSRSQWLSTLSDLVYSIKFLLYSPN